MQLHRYGIILTPVEAGDLETVRHWRNADHVRKNMQYQELITAEMQQHWFDSLDKNTNLYFIIHAKAEKAGVVNLKNIDRQNGTAEAGIFIGETEFLNTTVPVAATILIMELAFGELHLKSLHAKIAANNQQAIKFNEALGYVRVPDGNNDFPYYSVNAARFERYAEVIKKTLNKF